MFVCEAKHNKVLFICIQFAIDRLRQLEYVFA